MYGVESSTEQQAIGANHAVLGIVDVLRTSPLTEGMLRAAQSGNRRHYSKWGTHRSEASTCAARSASSVTEVLLRRLFRELGYWKHSNEGLECLVEDRFLSKNKTLQDSNAGREGFCGALLLSNRNTASTSGNSRSYLLRSTGSRSSGVMSSYGATNRSRPGLLSG